MNWQAGCRKDGLLLDRVTLVAGALLGTIFGVRQVCADFIVLDRLSEISFTQVAIGEPNSTIRSTDLEGLFTEILTGESSYEEPAGALNYGSWAIQQVSEPLARQIDCDASQAALTTTDFGSPNIFTGNRFRVSFQVLRPTDVRLRGEVNGCPALGCENFARVQLLRGSLNLFNTGFGQVFPFETTLEPGFTYTLALDLAGRALANGTTSSRARASLIEISCAGDADLDGDVDLSDLATLLAHFGAAGDVVDGDCNEDGSVDLGDLAQLLANFGATCP